MKQRNVFTVLDGVAVGSRLCIESTFCEGVFMNYQKFFIVLIAACIFAASSVQVDAAVIRHSLPVIKHIKPLIERTSNGIGNAVWRNKGAIAVGTTAVVVATKPEVAASVVTGTTERIITTDKSTGSSVIARLLFYLLVAVLVIAGVRYCLQSIGLRRILPLLVLGVLLFCGNTAEAGMFDYASFPEIECGAAKKIPWWNVITIILLLVAIFTGSGA